MTKPVIVLTRRFPDRVEEEARARFQVIGNPDDTVLSTADVVAQAKAHGAEGILFSPTEPFDAQSIAALPDCLRVLATFSVGHDHVDLEAARGRGIIVTNTPDVLTEATADIAMLCLLGAARRAFEAQTMLREGRWGRWTPTALLGTELCGSRIGIVGMGRIGRAMARRATGFGMRVRYWNRSPVPAEDLAAARLEDAERVDDLDALFRDSDIVSLHVAGTAETRQLVDARRLALLPRGAILVNTARGTLIDDEAVLAALADGGLGGVGLDVFEGEPALHPGYLEAPNAYLLPHIGSATLQTRENMGLRALANLVDHFEGRMPRDSLT